MESDEECNTGLCLGLGMGATKVKKQKLVNKPVIAPCFDLAFELCSKGEPMNVHNNNKGERINLERHQYYQNVTCSTDSDNNNNNDRRKKLRLTKEQSSMLESTFKLHNTLNPVSIHSFIPICIGM